MPCARAQYIVYDPKSDIAQTLDHVEDLAKYVDMVNNQVQQIEKATQTLNQLTAYVKIVGDPSQIVNVTGVSSAVSELKSAGVGQPVDALANGQRHLRFAGQRPRSLPEYFHDDHRYYTRELRSSLRDRYELDFFLGGRCPATGAVKVFKFVSSEEENATYGEVLQTRPFSYDVIGAGDDRFRARLEADLASPGCRVNLAVFRRLRDVIRDPTIASVDGHIQAGAFEDGEFSLYGMFEFDLSGEYPRTLQSVRGLVLDEVYRPEDPTDFHITYSFFSPFQSDLDQLTG